MTIILKRSIEISVRCIRSVINDVDQELENNKSITGSAKRIVLETQEEYRQALAVLNDYLERNSK